MQIPKVFIIIVCFFVITGEFQKRLKIFKNKRHSKRKSPAHYVIKKNINNFVSLQITKLHRILQYYGAAADLILNKEVRSMISCNETKTYDMLHVRNQITPILCDIELETNAHIPKVEIKNKLLRNMNLDCSTSLMYKSIIGRKFIALLNNVLQKLKRKRHKSKNISKSRSRNSSE